MSTALDPTWHGLESFAHPVTAVVVGASRGIGLAFVDSLLRDRAVVRERLETVPGRVQGCAHRLYSQKNRKVRCS